MLRISQISQVTWVSKVFECHLVRILEKCISTHFNQAAKIKLEGYFVTFSAKNVFVPVLR